MLILTSRRNVLARLSQFIGGMLAAAFVPSSAAAQPLSRRNVDVTTHGAIGDGSMDCTQAFRGALAELVSNGGGELYIPVGTYRLTGPLTVQNVPLSIRGS